MKKAMTVTYFVGRGLYVNMTNRCTNSCDFCIRNNDDGAYGSSSLWLLSEPSVDFTVSCILEEDRTKFDELVFCGYGEPSVRLHDAVEVAKRVKQIYPDLPIRINTNGHSDLIFGFDTAPLYEGAFDTVSISLNTPSAEKYCSMCHPVYGSCSFDALLTFAKNVKKYVRNTVLSVVRETLTERELSECFEIADGIGVTLKVRTYIGKSTNP